MTPDHRRPAQKPGVVHYDVLSEMVVYCPDSLQAASLNVSARAIWELCDGTRTVENICAELAEWTGMSPTQLHDDVQITVDRLQDLNLLTSDIA